MVCQYFHACSCRHIANLVFGSTELSLIEIRRVNREWTR